MPNKIFEYAAHGLPVITSLPGEAKELLEKHQLGFYSGSSHLSMAKLLVTLLQNSSLRISLGSNALDYARTHFYHDSLAKKFASWLLD